MVKLIKRNMSKRGKKSFKKRSKKAGTPGMAYMPKSSARTHVNNVNIHENLPTSTVKYYPTQDAYEAAKQEYSNKHTPEELEQWRKENKGPISGNLTKLFRGFSSGGKRRRTRKSKKSRKSRRKMTKRRRH